MSNNNNYFTPEDDDEDYGFIDFEDDNYDGSDDEYYDNDDEYADSYNDSDDDYSINRNYNKYDSKASNQKNNSQGLVSFILSEAFSFFKIVAFAAIFALIFTNFIIINAEVPSGSMRDTIWEGDRLFGFRLSYKFSEPERGDIIIFKFPDDESQNYVKRIIGLPNDIVQIKVDEYISTVMSLMNLISRITSLMMVKHILILFLKAVILCLATTVTTPRIPDTGLTLSLKKRKS